VVKYLKNIQGGLNGCVRLQGVTSGVYSSGVQRSAQMSLMVPGGLSDVHGSKEMTLRGCELNCQTIINVGQKKRKTYKAALVQLTYSRPGDP